MTNSFDVDPAVIDAVHKREFTPLELPLTNNSYAILTSQINQNHSTLVRYCNGYIYRISQNRSPISPKDALQASFMDSLLSNDILISVGIGSAGTGKTTLALAAASQAYLEDDRHILLTKPAQYVGNAKAFGTLPGTLNEKYAPFLESYNIVLKEIFSAKGENFLGMMQKKEHLRFMPIEYCRGCTFKNSTVIIDECQNLLWHELKTIMSRVGDNSKLVLLGDPEQIDIRIPFNETGLGILLKAPRFQNSDLTSIITLTKQYRGPIPQLISDIDKDLEQHGKTNKRNSHNTGTTIP